MKKIKFKLTACVIAASILIPAAAASAQETTQTGNRLSNFITKQQERIETRTEREKYRPSLVEKKDTIKKNHETNSALRKSVAEKRTTVKSLIKSIMENRKELTAEYLQKLEVQMLVIKEDLAVLESLRGTIKEKFSLVKEALLKRDYAAALEHLDSIISIQNTRTEGLNKLNADLDAMIELLKAAPVNTAAPTL